MAYEFTSEAHVTKPSKPKLTTTLSWPMFRRYKQTSKRPSFVKTEKVTRPTSGLPTSKFLLYKLYVFIRNPYEYIHKSNAPKCIYNKVYAISKF